MVRTIKTSTAETAIKRFPFDLMTAMTIKQGKPGAISTLGACYARERTVRMIFIELKDNESSRLEKKKFVPSRK